MGLISGRKAFQRPMDEGVELLNAIQDVYLDKASRSRSARAATGQPRTPRLPWRASPMTDGPPRGRRRAAVSLRAVEAAATKNAVTIA
jgi:hypothetical protein